MGEAVAESNVGYGLDGERATGARRGEQATAMMGERVEENWRGGGGAG